MRGLRTPLPSARVSLPPNGLPIVSGLTFAHALASRASHQAIHSARPSTITWCSCVPSRWREASELVFSALETWWSSAAAPATTRQRCSCRLRDRRRHHPRAAHVEEMCMG
jgi:hypothetical protein